LKKLPNMPSRAELVTKYQTTKEEVDRRITHFKGFTGVEDEQRVLAYLQKGDLDVQRAVNLFFDGVPLSATASPENSPPPAAAQGNAPPPAASAPDAPEEDIEMGDPPPVKKEQFGGEDSTSDDPAGLGDDDLDLDAPPKRKRPRRRVKVDLDLCSDESSSEPEPPKKKRKPNPRPPPRKRRPLVGMGLDGDSSSEGEDDNLVFAKPVMSEDDDSDYKEPLPGGGLKKPTICFDDEEEYVPEKVDLNWERKPLGQVRIKFKRDKKEFVDFFRTCLSVKQGLNAGLVKLVNEKDDKPLLDEIIKAETDKKVHVWITKAVEDPEEKDAEDVDPKMETVVCQLFLYVVKAASKKSITLDHVVSRIGSATPQIKALVKEAQGLAQKFKDSKNKLSQDGILDFAQKFETTEEEEQEFGMYPDQRHGLRAKGKHKITLNKYQHQAVNQMIKEERAQLGIQRHFWQRQEFSSGDPFWYSPFFKEIRFEPPIPTRGGLLCEEMGLGKTIEMLAVCNTMKPGAVKPPYICSKRKEKRYPSRATLVVSPTSLVGQWQIEIQERNAKKLKILCYYGGKRPKDPKIVADYDFVLTTYGIIKHKKETENAVLQKIDWHRVVLDESHSIKAGNTAQTKQCVAFSAKTRWCLTGTPFVSTLKDAHQQFHFLGAGEPVCTPVTWTNAVKDMTSGKHEKLTGIFRLFKKLVIRHRKDQQFNGEPIVTLPPKKEEFVPITMPAKQMGLYHILYDIAKKQYDQFKSRGEVSRNYLKIVQLLRPIRKACSGGEFDVQECKRKLKDVENGLIQNVAVRSGASAAAAAGCGGLKHAVAEEEAYNSEDTECGICLELIEEPLQTPCRHMFCGECIQGCVQESIDTNKDPKCPVCRKPIKMRQLKKPKGSAPPEEKKKPAPKVGKVDGIRHIVMDTKLKELVKRLEKIRRETPNQKALVFTTFPSTLAWLQKELPKRGFQFRTIKGSMTMEARRKALVSFQKDPPTTVFLLSVRSGAVGITLTAAQHVFMLEPCANIALYRQAVNRVYRLGQTKQVHIRTLYMANTCEESLIDVNKNKDEADFSGAGNIAHDKTAMRSEEFDMLFKDYRPKTA